MFVGCYSYCWMLLFSSDASAAGGGGKHMPLGVSFRCHLDPIYPVWENREPLWEIGEIGNSYILELSISDFIYFRL